MASELATDKQQQLQEPTVSLVAPSALGLLSRMQASELSSSLSVVSSMSWNSERKYRKMAFLDQPATMPKALWALSPFTLDSLFYCGETEAHGDGLEPQSHTAKKWWLWDLSLGYLIPRPAQLHGTWP